MSGWTTKKLGEVCEIFRGGSPRPIKSFITNEPNGINWIKIGDTDLGGKYISSCAEKIKPSGVQYSRYVERGDFLISNSMSFGRPYILKINGCIHDGWLVIKKYEGTFDQDFLFYLLQSPSVQFQFNDLARGSTVRNLNRELVARVKVHYPETVAEQKRIVAKIDAAFEKIDRLKANAEKNLANAKELFQSALDEAMRPKKGWVEKRLPDISENNDSKRVPITKNQREPGSIPYYGASGIVDYVKDYIFDGEYLLVSEDGANLESRTYPIAFSITGKSWVNNHAHILEFKNGDVQAYVELYLNAIPLKDFITGAAQPKLTQENLNKIPIHLPSDHAKLSEIVRRLKLIKVKLETLQQNYARQVADCAEMRQAILREAFEGRL